MTRTYPDRLSRNAIPTARGYHFPGIYTQVLTILKRSFYSR
jgi:hypothetical protein